MFASPNNTVRYVYSGGLQRKLTFPVITKHIVPLCRQKWYGPLMNRPAETGFYSATAGWRRARGMKSGPVPPRPRPSRGQRKLRQLQRSLRSAALQRRGGGAISGRVRRVTCSRSYRQEGPERGVANETKTREVGER